MGSRIARLLAYSPILLIIGLLFTVSFVKTINAGDGRSAVQKPGSVECYSSVPEVHGQPYGQETGKTQCQPR